ncbi:MAG: hypothetical protein MZV70_71320 [Desulfobacterales bacterium]|nr:hypothetical protein [Desulfobacterales bacterium]
MRSAHLRPAAAGPDRPAGSPSGTARRSTKEMIYDEEFRELARRFPNFTYTVALSEPLPEDNWDGPVGFIHQVAHDLYLGRHEDPDRNRVLPVRAAHDAAGGGEGCWTAWGWTRRWSPTTNSADGFATSPIPALRFVFQRNMQWM